MAEFGVNQAGRSKSNQNQCHRRDPGRAHVIPCDPKPSELLDAHAVFLS